MNQIIIDADALVYRAGFAAERVQYQLEYGGGRKAVFDSAEEKKEFIANNRLTDYTVERFRNLEPVSHAINNLKTAYNNLIEAMPRHNKVYLYLSDGTPQWRYNVATIKEYKGNRKDAPRPTHYQALREYMINHIEGTHVISTAEADDACIMRAELCDDPIIVAVDKDLKQYSGLFYNWVTREFDEVDYRTAATNLIKGIFSGDSADNIPGLAGIGDTKAAKYANQVPWKGVLDYQYFNDSMELFRSLIKEYDELGRYKESASFYRVNRKVMCKQWRNNTLVERSGARIFYELFHLHYLVRNVKEIGHVISLAVPENL